MAKDKKSFLLYCDQKEIIKLLSMEQRGLFITAIYDYTSDLEVVIEDPLVQMAFTLVQQVLKRDLKKYEGKKKQNSNSGIEGNLKRWHEDLYNKYKDGKITLEEAVKTANERKTSPPDTDTSPPDRPQSPPIAKIAVNVTVTDSDTVNDILLEKETKGDKPPVFMFKKSLLDFGFKKELVVDFLKNRKTKKLSNTETALNSFIEEIEKTGREKNEIFKIIVEKGWGGFKASWSLEDQKSTGPPDNGRYPKQSLENFDFNA